MRRDPRESKKVRGPRMADGEKRDCEIKPMLTYSAKEETKRLAAACGKSVAFYAYEAVMFYNQIIRAGAAPTGVMAHFQDLAFEADAALAEMAELIADKRDKFRVLGLVSGNELAAREREAEAVAEGQGG